MKLITVSRSWGCRQVPLRKSDLTKYISRPHRLIQDFKSGKPSRTCVDHMLNIFAIYCKWSNILAVGLWVLRQFCCC